MAVPEASAEAVAVPFMPELEAVIAAYPGTEPVCLPDPDPAKYEALEADRAIPPGVMPYYRNVIVDKQKRRLQVVTPHGDVVDQFSVCASRNRGQKRRKDDCKTPEGTFQIIGIYNSTDWTYKDTGQKAYGPFFVHLNTHPFYGIGIHGTPSPGSIPGRSSHGCIRVLNDNVKRLRSMLYKDSRVTILSDTIQDMVQGEGVRTGEVEHGPGKPIVTYVTRR